MGSIKGSLSSVPAHLVNEFLVVRWTDQHATVVWRGGVGNKIDFHAVGRKPWTADLGHVRPRDFCYFREMAVTETSRVQFPVNKGIVEGILKDQKGPTKDLDRCRNRVGISPGEPQRNENVEAGRCTRIQFLISNFGRNLMRRE